MGLLSGLGNLGLGNLESMSLYEDTKKTTAEIGPEEEKGHTVEEKDFLFEKSYKCPVCGKDFKCLSIRAGRAKLVSMDIDLRPNFDGIEPLKYDVVMCPGCGYAALSRYWGNPTPTQIKNIREQISKSFRPKTYRNSNYTYEEAFERYQMALANSIVKVARASEKAYICLKTGWLLRSSNQELEGSEDEYLKNALEGFINARQNETFPICGMDENTLDYLIAALLIHFKEYEQSSKLVGNLLMSKTANARTKDKALALKEIILKERKS